MKLIQTRAELEQMPFDELKRMLAAGYHQEDYWLIFDVYSKRRGLEGKRGLGRARLGRIRNKDP